MRFEVTGERALRVSGVSGGGDSSSRGGSGAFEEEATVGGFLRVNLRGVFEGALRGVLRGVVLVFGCVYRVRQCVS